MTPISAIRPATRTRLGQAILLALIAGAAHAEDVPDNSKDPSATLGTIIVTSEKRSEDVMNVPMSVGVIDADQLQNLHATQLADYAAYIPGLTISDGGAPGSASIGIRGISPLTATSTVATYIDETPIGSSSMYGDGGTAILDLLSNTFQSVEVLRGPQGTLYGASAMGGVIRYVTRAPDLAASSWNVGANMFSVAGAGDLGVGGHAGFSAPLVADKLALSVDFARQNTPGYIDNVQTGTKEQNGFWQRASRVALLWKASDDLSVTISAMDSKVDADSFSYVAIDPATLKPLYGKNKDDNYFAEPYEKAYGVYTATVNWNLGWADFVSATSYSRTDAHTNDDASSVYGPLGPLIGLPGPFLSEVFYHLRLYKTTQEFRLTSKEGDRIEWLVGAFGTRENSTQDQSLTAQFDDYSFIPGLNPLAQVGLPSTYKEYAAYGDLTYKFTGSFDVTAGVRWARNEQTFTELTSGAVTGTVDQPGSSAESVFTYSVSPRFHLNANTMIYARVATGYQPGGPNLALPGVPTQVDSSKLTSYEGGIKATLDDRRLTLDAAVYDVEWEKIQVPASINGVGYFTNGGTARSRGLEFSALYTPVAGLRLGLNGAYTDAVLTEDVPGIGGLDGDRLPNIPKWSTSATADYNFPLGNGWTGRLGGGLRYVGASTSGLTHAPNSLPQDSYTALDLNADVSNDRWTVRLFAKNVTDKRVYTNYIVRTNAVTGGIGAISGVPLAPRTIGVGFDLKY
ncbi:MAG: TonB-dependent receptor [Rudaea sp.]|uniref:TonB-dependent receptor n=1 Tax=Rudaea sp. TaxID=2136325 RepID=UPI0039E3E408